MTFDSLIKLYTGIPCDFDGYYGTQCMDLMHFYKYLVLGVEDKTTLSAPNAKSVWYNFNTAWGTYFTKIANTPTGVPQRGDIVLWDGTDGHVAIFLEGTVNDFYSFDANYPTGSLPHRQYHNYDRVLGWLRFKATPITDWEKKYNDLVKAIKALIG
jgi:hypothetical protein